MKRVEIRKSGAKGFLDVYCNPDDVGNVREYASKIAIVDKVTTMSEDRVDSHLTIRLSKRASDAEIDEFHSKFSEEFAE